MAAKRSRIAGPAPDGDGPGVTPIDVAGKLAAGGAARVERMRWVETFLCLGMLMSPAAALSRDGFDVIVLGALGGIQDGNLSSYLIRPHGATEAVACDAGSLVNGLRIAHEKGAFGDVKLPATASDSVVGHVLKNHIKGYLISHPHLDHIAGLVIASPDDSSKTIYALPSVSAGIEQTYFNWTAWPDVLDRGKLPQLKKYHVQDLKPGEVTLLTGTAMRVTAFPLRHGGTESTGFLIESGDDAVLCLGDAGPDEVEKATSFQDMWTAIAEKVRQKRLKAIIMEASYTNDRPDSQLFGHLTPNWLLRTLRRLDQQAGAGALKGLPVVVSHIKYSLGREQPQAAIRRELENANDLGLTFVIPSRVRRTISGKVSSIFSQKVGSGFPKRCSGSRKDLWKRGRSTPTHWTLHRLTPRFMYIFLHITCERADDPGFLRGSPQQPR